MALSGLAFKQQMVLGGDGGGHDRITAPVPMGQQQASRHAAGFVRTTC